MSKIKLNAGLEKSIDAVYIPIVCTDISIKKFIRKYIEDKNCVEVNRMIYKLSDVKYYEYGNDVLCILELTPVTNILRISNCDIKEENTKARQFLEIEDRKAATVVIDSASIDFNGVYNDDTKMEGIIDEKDLRIEELQRQIASQQVHIDALIHQAKIDEQRIEDVETLYQNTRRDNALIEMRMKAFNELPWYKRILKKYTVREER